MISAVLSLSFLPFVVNLMLFCRCLVSLKAVCCFLVKVLRKGYTDDVPKKRMSVLKKASISINGRNTTFEHIPCSFNKMIRPFTPRHNGKVERSHRKDNEYFYASHKFYSFVAFKAQLAVHLRKYNNFPMRPLNWFAPKDTLLNFLRFGVAYH